MSLSKSTEMFVPSVYVPLLELLQLNYGTTDFDDLPVAYTAPCRLPLLNSCHPCLQLLACHSTKLFLTLAYTWVDTERFEPLTW